MTIKAQSLLSSLRELFVSECEEKVGVLSARLIDLESEGHLDKFADELLRAAHSIKGAARIVEQNAVVKISHLIEDCFVALLHEKRKPSSSHIDVLLKACDYIMLIARQGEQSQQWIEKNSSALNDLYISLRTLPHTLEFQDVTQLPGLGVSNVAAINAATEEKPSSNNVIKGNSGSGRLDRLAGLIEEALIDLRWIEPYSRSLQRLRQQQWELTKLTHKLRETAVNIPLPERFSTILHDLERQIDFCRDSLIERLSMLDSYTHQWVGVSSRLQREVLQARMRPFGDCVRDFPRLARDVAKSLGKQVRIEIKGHEALVDRDVISRIENPLLHLLYNAIDHGIETPSERKHLSKLPAGTLKISAYHQGGMLCINVADDGGGINIEALRKKILQRGLVSPHVANLLSNEELIDFIFLPQFTTKETVTEISGRGVGLDIVRDVMQELRGSIRASSKIAQGTEFQLRLPLTLSVVRVLLVDVSSEIFGIPLARIGNIVEIDKNLIVRTSKGDYFSIGSVPHFVIPATSVLGLTPKIGRGDTVKVVTFKEDDSYYGLIVDNFRGEQDLVLQQLPCKLGKIQEISAAAISNDGLPILIIDVESLLLSINHLQKSNTNTVALVNSPVKVGKRILVVDDSVTVREMQREILESRGFFVEAVGDGMEAWNALRNNHYDLVITDLDMPRITGIELVRLIKTDMALAKLPVIVVSFKDRDEDQCRVKEAGADYFFTKGSRYDDALAELVVKIISEQTGENSNSK